jgi:hypothetical protein
MIYLAGILLLLLLVADYLTRPKVHLVDTGPDPEDEE